MNNNEKTYRSLQVEFTPGIFLCSLIMSSFVFVTTNNYFYLLLCWLFIAFIYYRQKPLRYLFSKNKNYFIIFVVLIINAIILPIILPILFEPALSKLTVLYTMAVCSVLVFIFLIKFYTHERLKQFGWKNISGKWN